MKAWWPDTPHPGNVGDLLTAYMLRKDGVEIERVSSGEPGKLLGIGSVIRYAQPGDRVWTSGTPWSTHSGKPYHGSPQATYHALRGPLTMSAALLAGCVGRRERIPMGDGGLCLPRYYTPRRSPLSYALGVVPHYADLPHRDQWPRSWRDPNARLISPLRSLGQVEDFVDEIVTCERIESSSLHGCVIAEAYGIPWSYVPIDGGSRINGRDYKFMDFSMSLPHVNVDDLMEARPWA